MASKGDKAGQKPRNTPQGPSIRDQTKKAKPQAIDQNDRAFARKEVVKPVLANPFTVPW